MIRNLILLLLSLFILASCGTSNGAPSPSETSGEDVPVNSNPTQDDSTEQEETPLEHLQTTLDVNVTADSAEFKINLKNTGAQDKILSFTSGQMFEINVTDGKGKEVYRYSIDKSFIQALQDVELKAGEDITWQEAWDYNQTGERIPSGEYKATVEIIAAKVNDQEVSSESPVFTAEKSFIVPDAAQGNVAFRNVSVSGSQGEYKVTGEARVFEANFFYAVEDGHDYVIKETLVTADEGAPDWSQFEINISIPSDKLPENGTLMLEIYERSAKDGEIVNLHHTILETFK